MTHAVCVGMTGSGKTGLCVSLLEEAVLDNIPAIAIDPKGDLTNLLLTFPDLKMEDFLPWINNEDAAKKGLTPQDYAAKQAELWKNGLASWGQDGERIRRLRGSADFAIYTPGSTAGIPVSIMKSFAAPPQAVMEDGELLRERINTTVTSLLGMLGIAADPIKSREHILISTIINNLWQGGRDLDIATLIQQIQSPPVSKIGVLDVDAFYPAKDRFELALALNNLLAAPGFHTWMEGEALDIASMLYTPQGKPRLSVFYVAHLNDAERMFFVSLLLNQVLGWMRTQSGTTSLRAIVYMDEIFGYFPPVANPPSKTPLLTLLKQARAYGVGIVLATQNPVDLDYKGLSNTGTWFIGRLQTERDKARVLDGLEGAATTSGSKFDRRRMEETMAGLGNRVFLLNNVHEDEPVIFETRWAMSYLRGPLTRTQIKLLMEPLRKGVTGASTDTAPSAAVRQSTPAAVPHPAAAALTGQRPVLPPSVTQYFVPVRSVQQSGASLVYEPALISVAEIHFAQAKTGINQLREVSYITPVIDEPIAVDWDKASELQLNVNDLETQGAANAAFGEMPRLAGRAESYKVWNGDFVTWLYRTQKIDLWRSPGLKEVSAAGESERDFRVRLGQKAREQRDAAADKLRSKYAAKIATAQEQLRRAEQAVDREKEQAKQEKMQTAISLGSTVLGAFLGKKAISATTLGKAATTAKGVGRSMRQSQDVGRAQDTVAAVQQKLQMLEADFKAETDALISKIDPLTETLENIAVRPAKKDISVKLLALGWLPYWRDAAGKLVQAW